MKYLLLFYIFFFILPKDTYAYLDPGSGSYIIQVVIATILGSVYIFKAQTLKVSRYIKDLFFSFLNKKTKRNEE